jgi:hypothetical protein
MDGKLPTYTIPAHQRVLGLLDVRVVYTDAIPSSLYFAIPCEMGIDPRDSYAGHAFMRAPGWITSVGSALAARPQVRHRPSGVQLQRTDQGRHVLHGLDRHELPLQVGRPTALHA